MIYSIGDLVKLKDDPTNKVGIVVDKKLVEIKPYAAPIDDDLKKDRRWQQRLVFLCCWSTGVSQWLEPWKIYLINPRTYPEESTN